MIDQVFKVVQVLVNKENNGYLTPVELNLLAKQAQERILSNYFGDENFSKNKRNRGVVNRGYANLDLIVRQKISKFSEELDILGTNGVFNMPRDLRFIEDDGVYSLIGDETPYTEDAVITEEERSRIGFVLKSDAKPTKVFPVYTLYNNSIKVYPSTINRIRLKYVRHPKDPNWTYRVILGKEVFDMSNANYQDFELNESEFSNIVIAMLSLCGIVVRENNVIEVAESLKDKQKQVDNE